MRRSHSEFVEKLKSINPSVEVIGEYTKAQERIKVKCKECGYIWEPKAYYLTQGISCRYCSTKRGARNNKGKTGLKTNEKFISEMLEKHPEIKVLSPYVNGHTNVKLFCSACQHSWNAKPYSLLQGHGCPRCAKSGTSFMEQFIKICFERVLGTKNVLSRNKTAISMELDIYIPNLNIAIEPGNWYLHKKSLKRDEIKRNKCKEKGIRLITIYDKFSRDEKTPFESDCFTYEEDLNKADHKKIKELVLQLFAISNIDVDDNDLDWEKIEEEAYENAKAKTHKDFLKEMDLIHPNIQVIGEYKNANKRIHVKCTMCGFEWDGVPASMLAGDGCRKCGTKLAHAKFVKDQSEFEQQVKKANPDIEVIGQYKGRLNEVLARCRICGYEWSPKASSLLRGSNHKGWKTIHKNL